MRNQITKHEKEYAEMLRKEREEIERNPLIQYSTSELKAELRRRKRERAE